MQALKNKTFLLHIISIVAAYVFITILLSSGILNRQYRSLIVPIGVNIILAVSLNLVTGFLGELSLGHASFMSIGAYTGTLTTLHLVKNLPDGIGLTISILAGGMTAAVFGFLIGVPVLRLRGDYLAIVTLGFGEIVKSVINSLQITGGSKGISKIPLKADYNHYTFVFVLAVLTLIVITNLVNSRQGRFITSIRDNDIAAESIGIKISTHKILTFVIAAFFAGTAGVIYAHNIGIIKPGTFDYNMSIEILVIVVLGGMGSIKGSVIAAIILTALPELLRGADNYRMLIYSIVLIAIMIINNSKIKEGLLANKTFGRLLGKGGEAK